MWANYPASVRGAIPAGYAADFSEEVAILSHLIFTRHSRIRIARHRTFRHRDLLISIKQCVEFLFVGWGGKAIRAEMLSGVAVIGIYGYSGVVVFVE